MTPTELENLISSARFGTYVRLASGDRGRAVELYQWTGELAGALFTDYRMLEVVLRNRIDQAVTSYATSLDPSVSSWLDLRWLPHGANGWDDGATEAIRVAKRNARGRQPSHDAVLAQLTFGFWRFVVNGRYEEAFWLPALDTTFTGIPGAAAVDRRIAFEQAMINLNKLRNRIAHHEPICKPTRRKGPGGVQLTLTVDNVYKNLTDVVTWTVPGKAAELLATSRVPNLLTHCPI